jgi:pimeloyl-ACP methyl ester carboxylesterase
MNVALPRRWLSHDGLELFARDYAASEGLARLPVVCLHGLTRNSRDFEDVAPWLAQKQRRVLALDMRGRGHSAWDPAGNYDIPNYVADIKGLLDRLGIAKAVFVGTSMGGLITIELGTAYPDLVAGAVINDIGPQLSMVGLTRIASYVGQGQPLPDWQAAADTCARFNGDVFAHYGAQDWLAMAHRMFREEQGQIVADYDPAIAQALARLVADPDPWAKWHGFADNRPVLLLRGSATDLLDADVAEAMVAGKRQAKLATIAGIGHAPMMDEPDARLALDMFFNAID